MHNLESAAEQCERRRSLGIENTHIKCAVDLLDAQVHLRLFDKGEDKQRFEHLKAVFKLAGNVVAARPRISLAYKLPADALLRVIRYRDDIMKSVEIPASWSVSDRLSAVRVAVNFYSVALDLNRKNAWAWYDLAMALLQLAHVDSSAQHATKASDCLRKGMTMTKCPQTKSTFWTLLAEAMRLSSIVSGTSETAENSTALQQHYLVRELQLNKENDEAWLRL
ncbi:unnamed protein product, partial [Cylicostephanus goldi]